MSSEPILLPISTRSVGFIIRMLMNRLQIITRGIFNIDFYNLTNALYRLTLLKLHMKINRAFHFTHLSRNISDHPDFPPLEFCVALQSCNIEFTIIQKYLSGIGFVQYHEDYFVPFFPPITEEFRYCDPFNIRFPHLRELINLFANPDTQPGLRKQFYTFNSIPGAKWSFINDDPGNPLLTNPDDILPKTYEMKEVLGDIEFVTNIMRLVGTRYPRMVVEGLTPYDTVGCRGQLISCKPSPVRSDSYNTDALSLPIGNIETFWSPRWLNRPEAEMGVFLMCGEGSMTIINGRFMGIRFQESSTQKIIQSYERVVLHILSSLCGPKLPPACT
ncbi:unnamed protein product [Ceratitis capitata]|uniref:(Mediterranean fruit fly) hypothetical protein n=1 Tax=Ceratitis capitata TaxID=7213 RepID=W8C1U6_CERCA|nr:unnamed protein product [Ceratitis capitata]